MGFLQEANSKSSRVLSVYTSLNVRSDSLGRSKLTQVSSLKRLRSANSDQWMQHISGCLPAACFVGSLDFIG